MTTGFTVTEATGRPQAPAKPAGELLPAQAYVVELGGEYQTAVEAIDQRERTDLYTPEGRPRYVADEMVKVKARYDAERATHLARFREQLGDAEKEAADLVRLAETRLAAFQRRPVEYLAGDDLAIAAQRDRFVERDAEQRSLGQLAEQARAALARGDRVSAALLATHLPGRIERERQAMHDRNEWHQSEGLTALADLVPQLEAALLTESDRERRDKAQQLKAKNELQLQTIAAVRRNADPDAIADIRRRFGIRTY